MTLCTSGVFSTTTSFSPSMEKPISSQAVEPSARRRALNSGSVQARATTAAPSAGERRSIRSICAWISAGVAMPFSTISSRMAISMVCQ